MIRRTWAQALLVVFLSAAAPGAEVLAESFAVYGGIYDTKSSKENRASELGVEYRFAPLEVPKVTLRPAIGITNTDEDSFWIYGGLRLDHALGRRWMISPQFAVTLYEDGDGKDLGGVLEFRSGLEISYGFAEGPRVGLVFYHLSNGGFYSFNPGSNSLVLTVSLDR